MRAGLLLNRVTIQKHQRIKDAAGQYIESWVTVAQVWANIRHLNGSESIKANAVTSVVNASIRVRSRTEVDASCRVLHDGKTYDVEAVLPGPRQTYIDLVCKLVAT